jgi:two-component sensor histidine kinase
MHEYIEKLINNLFSAYNIDEANIQVKMQVDPIQLEIDYLIPIGLILNELISNALKYPFKGREKGTLEVTLHTWQNKLILHVKDDGIGMPNEIDFKHLSTKGYQLIYSFIKKLKAELYIDGTNGTTITLIIPNYHTKTAVYE